MNHRKNVENRSLKVRSIALTGLLFALALVLSLFERSLPALPFAPPGVKFGLSNIVVMYTMFFVGKRWAIALAVLKAGFVVMITSPVSGFVSLMGGLSSVLVMSLLIALFRKKISYFIISVFGAVFHNVGQLTAVSIYYKGIYVWWYYLPALIIFGIISGLITSFLLKLLLPALSKLGIKLSLEE